MNIHLMAFARVDINNIANCGGIHHLPNHQETETNHDERNDARDDGYCVNLHSIRRQSISGKLMSGKERCQREEGHAKEQDEF